MPCIPCECSPARCFSVTSFFSATSPNSASILLAHSRPGSPPHNSHEILPFPFSGGVSLLALWRLKKATMRLIVFGSCASPRVRLTARATPEPMPNLPASCVLSPPRPYFLRNASPCKAAFLTAGGGVRSSSLRSSASSGIIPMRSQFSAAPRLSWSVSVQRWSFFFKGGIIIAGISFTQTC